MGKTENVFILDSKDTRVGNSKSSVSNRLFSFSSEPEINFDITADWVSAGVTDQSSFEAYLQFSCTDASSVSVTNFSLVGNDLKANINVIGATFLLISGIGVVNVNKISGFDNSLIEINLNANQIVEFNPSISLPSSLQLLDLSNNLITDFNPSIALPIGLLTLVLEGNEIVSFNPSLSLPTSLSSLGLGDNKIVSFNPSLSLPISLMDFSLENNLMTTAGYSISETWATDQSSFTSTCQMNFSNNVNSITGTNLETILLTKNTIISP